jgi:hypothetical protein
MMNERIKELLIQSEVFNKDGTILKDVTGYELNKFAELIISKCLTICEELGDKGMDGHYCADEINRTFRS